MYFEKATKYCEISTLDLSYVVPVKSTVEILQNFVAFSEYMNSWSISHIFGVLWAVRSIIRGKKFEFFLATFEGVFFTRYFQIYLAITISHGFLKRFLGSTSFNEVERNRNFVS